MAYELMTEKQKKTAALALEIEKSLVRLQELHDHLRRYVEHTGPVMLEFLESSGYHYDLAKQRFLKGREALAKSIEVENQQLERLRHEQMELEKT